MTLKPLSTGNNHSIASNFFSKNENVGLFFQIDWSRNFSIYYLGNQPIFNDTGINNQTEKRAQYLDSTQIIDFDNFKPKENLQYAAYVKTEDGIAKCFPEFEHQTYKNIRNVANHLVDDGNTVVISEMYAKTKTLIPQSGLELDPFSSEKSHRKVFYYHSSSHTFSNLISEEASNIDRETMEKWFSIGYATIVECKRVAYFLFGKVTKHVKSYPKNSKFIVFSKEKLIKYFDKIEDALDYCTQKSADSEFLIAEQRSSIQWH